MNIQNCQKCNFPIDGADRFCKNCGAPAESAAPGLPPTVFGAPPNYFQPPSPPYSQPPPQFPPPQAMPMPADHSSMPVPQNSGGKKFALLGGIFGVIFILGGIVALLIVFVAPYLEEQARLRKERANQTRANSTTAISLLPEQYGTPIGNNSQTFRRTKTVDRLQLLQASQNLPPEMRSELEDIKDAAAAEYVSSADASRKVLLQIFKFDTPAQAVALCDRIGRELKKTEAAFQEVSYYPTNDYLPTNCAASVESKDKAITGVSTLYGFFIVYSGLKESDPKEARKQILNKLSE